MATNKQVYQRCKKIAWCPKVRGVFSVLERWNYLVEQTAALFDATVFFGQFFASAGALGVM